MKPDLEEVSTQTAPQRFGGWLRSLGRLVRLGMGGDDEELLVENTTEIAWYLYQNFHQLDSIRPAETHTLKLSKRGTLSARPILSHDEVEYLSLPLNSRIKRVRIYRRAMAQDLEVYDMQAA
jgi:hypothetical protein